MSYILLILVYWYKRNYQTIKLGAITEYHIAQTLGDKMDDEEVIYIDSPIDQELTNPDYYVKYNYLPRSLESFQIQILYYDVPLIDLIKEYL